MRTVLPSTAAEPGALLHRREEIMRRAPDIEAPNVRVWTIRRTDISRTNLVEMIGELGFHVHPDADHTLVVLEGRVCAWYGSKVAELGPGDYISILKGVPHKYKTVTPKALLMSFDAPPYDPAKTRPISEEGVEFETCPSLEKGTTVQAVSTPEFIADAEVILHLHVEVSEAKRTQFLDFCRRAFPIYESIGGNRMFLYEDTANPGHFDEVGYYRTAEDYRRSEDAIKTDPVQADLIREWRSLLEAPPRVTVQHKKFPSIRIAQ